ncbi:MAG TPA: hypothetical protein VK253_03915 [Candidatus Binatia bacterium]|nr:hypothetical protein [Candidatus Binatia bacterium]
MVKLGEILALVAVVIILVAALAVYAGVTYPTTVVNNQVSFTIGADSKTTTFVQSFLNDKVKIQVTVQTGAALWRAQIKNGDQILWEHSAAQGKQQSYNSDWISLPSGNYNFTFGTIGVGSLQASATVSSKGGFW